MTETDSLSGALRSGLAALTAVAALAVAPAADAQEPGAYALTGGEIHTLAGETISGGTVVVRDGMIEAVGADVSAPADAEVIDVSGQRVYPGMFDAVTRLGLTEIGAVDVTNDVQELGQYNPQIVAATAVHPASEHIPVARANGITHALSAPSGGIIAGRASLIHLDGWTVEEMMGVESAVMVIDFPALQTQEFNFETFEVEERDFDEAKEEFEEEVSELEEWLEAAAHYARATEGGSDRVERDLRLEALAGVVTGETKALVMASGEREIRRAVELMNEHGVQMILAGSGGGFFGPGLEVLEVTDLLSEHDIPVILPPTQRTPDRSDAPYDEPYALPGALHDAGVRFAFGTFNSSDVRTLPYEAGMGVPYGLPREEALRAITLYPARIFGVGDRLGTIEEGKIANLIVTDGDPLEITTRVHHLFIQGRKTSTDNKHRELYEKYRARPER